MSKETENVPEKLEDADKITLDNAKLKCELAREKAKVAIAQNENAELSYNNLVLQLAMKYKLEFGSVIEETGIIRRANQPKK